MITLEPFQGVDREEIQEHRLYSTTKLFQDELGIGEESISIYWMREISIYWAL